MGRLGWRGGLALGMLIGVVGAGLAESAVIARSFLLLMIAMPIMGAANAALQLSRFAAAEVHPPSEKSSAISNVVIGGTFGAIVGPMMAGVTGQQASQLGLNEFAGPYLVSLVLFAFGSVLIFTLLKPEPRDIGKTIEEAHPESIAHHGPTRPIPDILRVPAR